MGITSSVLKPQELAEFRKLNATPEDLDIPARPEHRTVTDRKGLIIFGIAVLILLPFLIYTLIYADVRRLYYGYDNCVNFCGLNNKKIDNIRCSGEDYTKQRYVNQRSITKSYTSTECVNTCPDEREIVGYGCYIRSGPEAEEDSRVRDRVRRRSGDLDIDHEDHEDLTVKIEDSLELCQQQWWKFLVSVVITIGISLLTLIAFRYIPAVLIWGVLVFSLVVFILGTVLIWFLYSVTSPEEERRNYIMIVGVVWTVLTVIITVVVICVFKKIQLVVQLYKEATKAVFAMPSLILVPVLTTVIQVIIWLGCVATTILMSTSATLKSYSDEVHKYEANAAMYFTLACNLFVAVWSARFISGLQYLVVAGSVATWYFAKNKQNLESPIATSFSNAFKFHLGSVAFGSLVLTLFAVLKGVLKAFTKNSYLRCVVEYCCSNLEAIFKFLSENSYIETAIHGQSFLRSGKRAAKMLLTNAGSVIAINSVGDFVLQMICFLLIVVTTAISWALWRDGDDGTTLVPTAICFLINFIIVVVIFGIFDSTIATLFICFCEDKVLNDGISKPYFMSRGLMEFVENSKKIYGKQEAR